MNKLLVLALLLVAITAASSCIALYLALSNSYRIVKIRGTVIPIKVVGAEGLLRVNECYIDIGNITGSTIFRIVKYCNNTIIVNRTIMIGGSFEVSNISKAFDNLVLRVVIYRNIANTIAPVPPIPTCVLLYVYSGQSKISRPIGVNVINRCILFPGKYSIKIVMEGETRNVTRPVNFSIEVILKVYREAIHVE